MPHEDPTKAVLQATLLGAISDVPGVGGAIAGTLQGVLSAAARARDEEWWATVEERIALLEGRAKVNVEPDDPEFVAAAYRLTRAAQETSDEDKRTRLAAALAYSGSWSDLPLDRRERMERLVAELSTRDVLLLRVLSDPLSWLDKRDPKAASTYGGRFFITLWEFLRDHLSNGESEHQIRNTVEDLQGRRLLGIFAEDAMAFEPAHGQEKSEGLLASQVLAKNRLTQHGMDFLDYLGEIGA